MSDVVEIFPVLVYQLRAIAHCHDALDDGFLGNALFTQVHQRVKLLHCVLVLSTKDNHYLGFTLSV